MKTTTRRFSALILVYLIALTSLVCVVITGAERPNYVYDWEEILTEEEIIEINTLCRDIDINTTVEIVIITLVSYDEPLKVADIDEARVKYFNDYALDGVTGIGKEDEDNGVLIILSTAMADYGIEVGYGLEGDLTDGECGRIGRDVINKYYKDEDYLSMFYKAVEAIGEEVGYGEPDIVIGPDESDESDTRINPIVLYAIAMVVVLALILYTHDQNRRARERRERRYRAREVVLRPPPPPPKPVHRYAECPVCETKRRTKQVRSKHREITENGIIYSILALTLLCLTCKTKLSVDRDKKRVETVLERQIRRKQEREEEERRRVRMEEVRRREREREDDDDDDYHSSFSSWGRSSSFGGGRSGGGGASGRLG